MVKKKKTKKRGRPPCGVNKQMLNTTIQEDVLSAFKDKCKDIGCPMNFVLEKFMIQFSNDELQLVIGEGIKVDKGDVDV